MFFNRILWTIYSRSFYIGKTEPNSKVKIDKKKVKVSDDGYFVFGLDRDRKYDVTIKLKILD